MALDGKSLPNDENNKNKSGSMLPPEGVNRKPPAGSEMTATTATTAAATTTTTPVRSNLTSGNGSSSRKESPSLSVESLLCYEAMPFFVDPAVFQMPPHNARLGVVVGPRGGPQQSTTTTTTQQSRISTVPTNRLMGGRTLPRRKKLKAKKKFMRPKPQFAQTTAMGASSSRLSKNNNSNARTTMIRDGEKTPVIANKRTRRVTGPSRASTRSAPSDRHAHLVEMSEHLTYSWEELGLGTSAGSPAWNEALKEKLRQNPSLRFVPQLSPQEILYHVRNTLRLETVLPPPDSALHKVLQHTRFENQRGLLKPRKEDEGGDDDVDDKGRPNIPLPILGRAYQDMVWQELHDEDMYRREYQFLTCDQVVNRLSRFESDATDLQRREERVQRTAQQMGLRRNHCCPAKNDRHYALVGQMLGYWRDDPPPPDAKKQAYWHVNFEPLLNRKDSFLTWHDQW